MPFPFLDDKIVIIDNWQETAQAQGWRDSVCDYPSGTLTNEAECFFHSGADFTPPAAAGRVFQDTTPVVVALHGLTGGALAIRRAFSSRT